MALNIGRLTLTSPASMPFDLPRRIELAQEIQSDQPSERVRVTYRLDPDHDLWFREAEGLVKSADRTEQASAVPTTFRDRLTLARYRGERLLTYELRQEIRDEDDRATSRQIVLQIS